MTDLQREAVLLAFILAIAALLWWRVGVPASATW